MSTLIVFVLLAAATPEPQRRPQPAAHYTTNLSLAEMSNKQAVVNTSKGTFVIDLKPELAPNHVGYFMKLAREKAYNGVTFHRVIRHGIIQGGDPLSKDPAQKARYGTGGLSRQAPWRLKAEFSERPMTRGSVAAVLLPGKPDSAGTQFFICLGDQPALTGKYTIFGEVASGMDVVDKIGLTPVEGDKAATRVEMKKVTVSQPAP